MSTRGGDKSRAPTQASSSGQAAMRATALTIGLVLLSRVLGVLRDVILAQMFGQGTETTIYRRAFAVPDLIALVLAGGALSSVFVPVFTEYWNENRDRDAWHVFGAVLCIVAASVAGVVVGMEVFVVPLTRLLNPLFGPAAVLETARLTQILLPAQWFFLVGGLMMGTLYARKRFLLPALAPVIYNAGIIIGALTQRGQSAPDISFMAWGALAGAGVGSFLLPVVSLFFLGAKWLPSFDTRHEGVRKIGQLMVPVILGLSLSQLIMWVTGFYFPEDYRLSALQNAYTLTQAPIGVFAQAFAIVLLPTISALAAQRKWPEFRVAISEGLRRVLFLTLPTSLLMAALAVPLIRFIYGGEKFGEDSVQAAALALLCYSLATFAWSSLAVLARAFYAMKDTWRPIIITTPMIVIFFGLGGLSHRLQPNGFTGIALAASGVGIVTALAFLWLLQKRVGGLDLRGLFFGTLRILLASALASGLAYFVAEFFESGAVPTRLQSAVVLVVAGGAGIAAYLVLCFLLRVPELRTIREMFRRSSRVTGGETGVPTE